MAESDLFKVLFHINHCSIYSKLVYFQLKTNSQLFLTIDGKSACQEIVQNGIGEPNCKYCNSHASPKNVYQIHQIIVFPISSLDPSGPHSLPKELRLIDVR